MPSHKLFVFNCTGDWHFMAWKRSPAQSRSIQTCSCKPKKQDRTRTRGRTVRGSHCLPRCDEPIPRLQLRIRPSRGIIVRRGEEGHKENNLKIRVVPLRTVPRRGTVRAAFPCDSLQVGAAMKTDSKFVGPCGHWFAVEPIFPGPVSFPGIAVGARWWCSAILGTRHCCRRRL
jgi:hypothetical protein